MRTLSGKFRHGQARPHKSEESQEENHDFPFRSHAYLIPSHPANCAVNLRSVSFSKVPGSGDLPATGTPLSLKLALFSFDFTQTFLYKQHILLKFKTYSFTIKNAGGTLRKSSLIQ